MVFLPVSAVELTVLLLHYIVDPEGKTAVSELVSANRVLPVSVLHGALFFEKYGVGQEVVD